MIYDAAIDVGRGRPGRLYIAAPQTLNWREAQALCRSQLCLPWLECGWLGEPVARASLSSLQFSFLSG